MSEFNPINIISNIAMNVMNAKALQNNAPNTGGATNAQNANVGQNFSNNLQSQNPNPQQMYFESSPITLSVVSELKLTTVEIEQKANYAKDLLNLPREFSELLELITTSPEATNLNADMVKKLNMLFQNGKVNLSMLSELLGQNSKEAMQKLMMTIANLSRYGANDVSGLKEFMNLFSANIAMTQDSQVVKNLLLLYLPWLPLSARSEDNLDFTIDIFDKIQGPDPDKDNPQETVTVLIETNNFSNVCANLEMNPLGQVDINIQAGGDFPHKRVIEMLTEEGSQNGIQSNILTAQSKEIEKKPAVQQDTNPNHSRNNVKISSQSSISPKLMLMTQSLIKVIINLDYEQTIIKKQDGDKQSEGEAQ